MTNQTLHVRIISPQQLILDAEAFSLSSENIEGRFDVLPQHANFMTLIENHPIIIRPSPAPGKQPYQKQLVFKFPLAIMLVQKNRVNIYTYS